MDDALRYKSINQLLSQHPDPIPIREGDIKEVARLLVREAALVTPKEKILLWFDLNGAPLVREIVKELPDKRNISFHLRDIDTEVKNVVRASDDEIWRYFSREKRLIQKAYKIIIVRSLKNPEALSILSERQLQTYHRAYEDAHLPRITGEKAWILTYWPTEYEAKLEGLTFSKYFNLWLQASKQPWGEIKLAQEHLKAILDRGEIVEVKANSSSQDPKKRTTLTMSIKGFTFCNATINRNFPGSEVFSAMERTSLNGQLFGNGWYLYQGKRMRDIRLKNSQWLRGAR